MPDAESAMMRLLTAIESRLARIEEEVRWLRERSEAIASEQRTSASGAAADTVSQHDKALDATLHPPAECS